MPPLVGRLWLLGSLALVLAPHLLRMPVGLALGCVVLVGWRLLRDLKGWELPSRSLSLLLTLGAFAAVLVTYKGGFNRDASVALLSLMLCLKLLELRTLRDGMVVVFLGYFLVITGFLYSQTIFTGIYMLAVVVALTTALVALNHPAGITARSKGYLRLAGGLLVQALPMMVVLFLLFPRVPGPLWSLPEGSSAKTGLSDDMNFGQVSDLAESEEVAFRVRFEGGVPAADRLYWRGPVLWFTDGRRWRGIAAKDPRALALGQAQYERSGEPIRYTVTLEPHGKRWVFALDLPARSPPAGGQVRGDFQMLSGQRIDELLQYPMSSYLEYHTGPLDADQAFLGLRLPDDINPKTRWLGEEWLASGLSDAEIVEQALARFETEPFFYTRQPPALLSDHPVDEFLFETRRGFCEHYAAAFVTLMRAADIPARVVTGYQGGELNPVGDYLIVRQSDAHAWAEVWLRDRGWVRVDPTAAIPPDRVEAARDSVRFTSTAPVVLTGVQNGWLEQALQQFRSGWDAVNHGWNQWVLGFNQRRQHDLLKRLGFGDVGWREMIAGLMALLAGTVAVVALYLFRPRQAGLDAAARLYAQFCGKLARRGLARRPNEGPLDFAVRAAEARPELRSEIEGITDAYARLRYGQADPAPWLPQLKQRVKRFRP